MSKFTSALVGSLAFVALAACSESQLTVANKNAPDQTRALASPTDVENLVVGQFRVISNNSDGLSVSLEFQLECLGMENGSGLGNAEAGKFCGIPRVPIDNTRGNASYAEKFNPYQNLYRAARSVAMGLNAMAQTGFSFVPADPAQVTRDQAFGYFSLGVALGDIALVYDSGAVVSPSDDINLPPAPLVSAESLMVHALAFLDTAQQMATSAAVSGKYPLPSTWINGNGMDQATFVQLIHSWKARFRAGVARDPADRAAVDWATVIADAQAGLTKDFNIEMTTSPPSWNYRPAQMDLFSAWHQMWQYMVGMADTSGTYSLYLANRSLYSPFLVITPDKRFPTGTHRAMTGPGDTLISPTGSQNVASGCFSGTACSQPTSTAPYPYFRNRLTGGDTPIADYMYSMYDFYRFQKFFDATRNGPIPTFTKAELNGLIAEGKLRSGATHDAAGALAAINATRTAVGLPPVTGDSGTVVPGGGSCVPQVPQAPGYSSAACGTVWEAMKYEKRLETAYTHLGAWWTDGRGWGDLPPGSVEEYPTPYEELDTRLIPIYSLTRLSTVNTYGFGSH